MKYNEVDLFYFLLGGNSEQKMLLPYFHDTIQQE